jgi:hypothetical protein
MTPNFWSYENKYLENYRTENSFLCFIFDNEKSCNTRTELNYSERNPNYFFRKLKVEFFIRSIHFHIQECSWFFSIKLIFSNNHHLRRFELFSKKNSYGGGPTNEFCFKICHEKVKWTAVKLKSRNQNNDIF